MVSSSTALGGGNGQQLGVGGMAGLCGEGRSAAAREDDGVAQVARRSRGAPVGVWADGITGKAAATSSGKHGGDKVAREEAGNDEVWIFMQSQKEDHAKSKRGPIRK